MTRRLHILDGLLIAYLNIDAVIKIIRTEDEPKPVLMKRFKLSRRRRPKRSSSCKLRHLAKLEEMKIRGEQEELATEQADLEATLKSKARLAKLIKGELTELAEQHGDARRTAIVEREAGAGHRRVRARHERSRDRRCCRSAAGRARPRVTRSTSSRSVVSLGRSVSGRGAVAAAISLPCSSTARAAPIASVRTRCRRRAARASRLSGHFNPPDGASFRAVLIGQPEDRWVVASSAGYGFVVKLEELYSRNKAGKAVLRVPHGQPRSCRPRPSARTQRCIAAVSSDGRLLVFELEELPELARGKGNKILGLPEARAARRSRRSRARSGAGAEDQAPASGRWT